LEGRHAKNLGELAATADARDFGNRRGFVAVWLGYGTPTRTSYLGTIRTTASDDPPPIKPKLELGAVDMARRVRYRGGDLVAGKLLTGGGLLPQVRSGVWAMWWLRAEASVPVEFLTGFLLAVDPLRLETTMPLGVGQAPFTASTAGNSATYILTMSSSVRVAASVWTGLTMAPPSFCFASLGWHRWKRERNKGRRKTGVVHSLMDGRD
jgi:hypothetical protein